MLLRILRHFLKISSVNNKALNKQQRGILQQDRDIGVALYFEILNKRNANSRGILNLKRKNLSSF